MIFLLQFSNISACNNGMYYAMGLNNFLLRVGHLYR